MSFDVPLHPYNFLYNKPSEKCEHSHHHGDTECWVEFSHVKMNLIETMILGAATNFFFLFFFLVCVNRECICPIHTF
jgi:hypothetical protein